MSKLLRLSVIVGLCTFFITTNSDTYTPNHAEITAHAFTHNLLLWEASNILAKWTHRVKNYANLKKFESQARKRQLWDYFGLGVEVTKLKLEIAQKASSPDRSYIEISQIEDEISRLQIDRDKLVDDVEETLELKIHEVLIEQGLTLWNDFVFPPVDIKLTQMPKLLITSPRKTIHRTHELLIKPDIKLEQIENLEKQLLDQFNLSAVITPIGGIATYPASLPNDRALRPILQTSAHEWLHHYFFFKPLGSNIFASEEMKVLNETAADIAGLEIGSIVLSRMTSGSEQNTYPRKPSASVDSIFDYSAEMRETRLRVEELLKDGHMDEAEQYMEHRRKMFVENGVFIRKLNQAYFAFHGTYANSPTSISPIGDQLKVFRTRFPNVGSFIKEMSQISDYKEFLEVSGN